ncbi:MAG: HsdR family type I site-specific deoxyribonuclease [Paludibacteraceae bacterium]|nr:HsdR family type I site-specific deoxyribonuclease [Paludibacteraceae bacterium]
MIKNFFATRPVDPEREVQLKVLEYLDQYCHYTYIGYLKHQNNSPIREETLTEFLCTKQNCTPSQANEAIAKLKAEAHCSLKEALYNANKRTYLTFRYPVPVREQNTRKHKSVWLIDWEHPENNIYEVAEEVSVACDSMDFNHIRPDVVLYVNGIALVVLELKKSTVSAKDAIRQNIRNQELIPNFFAVPQLLLAGNPSEGLYYGTTLTPEKYWLRWKEPTGDAYPSADIAQPSTDLWTETPPFATQFSEAEVPNLLYRSLLQMLTPPRLLEFIHDLTVFDGGIKKVARPNQYFALKAAQQRVKRHQGGIIWHSQGSGKSLTMVWLAQWIKETQNNARVVIITDRDELDKQITNGFSATGENPYRATSGTNLLSALDGTEHHLICTLIHKFGAPANQDIAPDEIFIRGERNYEQYMAALARNLPAGFKAKGNIFVFIDECHRTQGGLLNKAMRAIMGEDVMMIGFTGTPLLKTQKGVLNSYQNFGPYIHTYKFDEAVEDGVILDLRYEARNIDQNLSDSAKLDSLFDVQTRGLTPKAKEELQSRWATMQNIYSSKDRKTQIVKSINYDFLTVPCLRGHWGNAILVASSIRDAFQYWELFMQNVRYVGHVAVVSSLDVEAPGLDEAYSGESESDQEYKQRMLRKMCGDKQVDAFEEQVKNQFIKEPGQMWILIVVDKLLTGFDAPTATYLYIDKEMKDHNLFQAICRVNRVNGEQKDYGYIVDFKNLFASIEGAISDYTNGAFSGYEAADVEGLLQSRITQGRKDLEAAQERCRLLAEPVAQPRKEDEFFDYFGFNQATTPTDEQEAEIIRNAQKRDEFYDACNRLVRAFRAISMQMSEAGYSAQEASDILREVKYFDDVRMALMLRCGDYLDLKRYDAEMRALLDDYIEAHDAVKMDELSDFSFLEIIQTGEDTDEEESNLTNVVGSEKGVAETIAANVRRVINRKKESNPEEYRLFSERLNRLLEELHQGAITYKAFLQTMRELMLLLRNKVQVDPRLDTDGKRSLYDNCGHDVEFALYLYDVIKANAKHNFRNNSMRKRMLLSAITEAVADKQKVDVASPEEILSIVVANQEFGS